MVKIIVLKKAQGHVEIMISFALFIGVLIFILLFMNPLAKTQEKVSFINKVEQTIIQNVSVEIGKISVILNDSGDCYNSNAVKEYGLEFIEVQDNPRKYTIYYNELFGSGGIPGCSPGPEDYQLGVYSKEQMFVYEKIQDLIVVYNLDEDSYKNLKKALKITDDFLFQFKDINGNEVPELSVSRTIPSGVNVESKEFPVRMIDELGNIQELILNIRAW